MRREELEKKIRYYNKQYRLGNSEISDIAYDALVDELKLLDPHNNFFKEVGYKVKNDKRKKKLEITMASMEKVKDIEELLKWSKNKNIEDNEEIILTPKLDGLSFVTKEKTKEGWTRGDGEYGQQSDEHYSYMNNNMTIPKFEYTFGEVIMKKSIFEKYYKNDFANPRNLVSGLLNKKTPSQKDLENCDYIRYGAIGHNFKTKLEVLNTLNKYQNVKIPFSFSYIKDLTEEYLKDLFEQWSKKYEIDGIIIELNSLSLQNYLGRERNSNPCWARAYKSKDFEESAITKVKNLKWEISKQGYLKPVVEIEPVRLNGVTISNVTGNNARFVKDLGIGVGAVIEVKRSGMVIPIISDVIESVEFTLPENVQGETEFIWNENEVELMTVNETEHQKIKQLISAFEILEIENVGEGIIKKLFENGYNTLKKIVTLNQNDLLEIEGFGERKAEIVYNSIKEKTQEVYLSKLQHLTGFFNPLGSKKLKLLEHFESKPSIEKVLSIEGFAEKSAKVYIDNYDKFFDYIKSLPIKIKTHKIKTNGKFNNIKIVFSGIRMPEYKKEIEKEGGKVVNSVSKTTSYLVMKNKGSGSSKEKKAIKEGVKILNVEEFKELFNNKMDNNE